jgi:hypothetical protein
MCWAFFMELELVVKVLAFLSLFSRRSGRTVRDITWDLQAIMERIFS